MVVQQLVQAINIKEISKHYWHFMIGIHQWPVDSLNTQGASNSIAFPCLDSLFAQMHISQELLMLI